MRLFRKAYAYVRIKDSNPSTARSSWWSGIVFYCSLLNTKSQQTFWKARRKIKHFRVEMGYAWICGRIEPSIVQYELHRGLEGHVFDFT